MERMPDWEEEGSCANSAPGSVSLSDLECLNSMSDSFQCRKGVTLWKCCEAEVRHVKTLEQT